MAIERHPLDVPSDLVIDRLTAYVFKHYARFLNEEERALARLRISRLKRVPKGADERERFFRVDDLPTRFPDLHRRLQNSSISAEMAHARDRVLREHGGEVFLNKCPKCGELCLTPRAKACLDCGHTWHGVVL